MQIVMCIGLGALAILGAYWVGLGRLQKAVKAGYAERDHKIRSWRRRLDELESTAYAIQKAQAEAPNGRVIALQVWDLGDLAGTHTRMSAQVLRVTCRSDLAIAVVQAFIVFFNHSTGS